MKPKQTKVTAAQTSPSQKPLSKRDQHDRLWLGKHFFETKVPFDQMVVFPTKEENDLCRRGYLEEAARVQGYRAGVAGISESRKNFLRKNPLLGPSLLKRHALAKLWLKGNRIGLEVWKLCKQ